MGRGKRQRARASVRETAKRRLEEEWESESAAEENGNAGSYAEGLGLAKNRDEQAGEEREAGEKACGEARQEGEASGGEE